MFGPIYHLETLLGNRHSRLAMLRRVYAGWLILQFGFLFYLYFMEAAASQFPAPTGFGKADPRITSRFINTSLNLFLGQHFLLLLLLTPPFVAGAVADEKTKGTLETLLTTDIDSWEIVVDKLLGRLAQTGQLALVGLPLIAGLGGFVGVKFLAILALAAVTAGLLFALGAASILASVWSRQTRIAVMRVYLGIAIVVLISWGYPQWGAKYVNARSPMFAALEEFVRCLNPLHVLAPAWEKEDWGMVAQRLLTATSTWGLFGSACLGLSAWRLRPACFHQIAQAREENDAPARHVDEDAPLAWKEREVERLAVLPRIPAWLSITLTVAVATLSFYFYCDLSSNKRGDELDLLPGLVVLLVSSLYVGVRSSGAVTREREQQTWRLLLLSSLTNREIVQQKVKGILQSTIPYLLAYAIPAIILSVLAGLPLQIAWTLCVLLLSAASMYYMAATGISCSLQNTSSWRSLLETLVKGYGYGLLLLILSTLFVIWFAGFAFLLTYAFLLTFLGLLGLASFSSDEVVPFAISFAIIVYGVGVAYVYCTAAFNTLESAIQWMTEREIMRNQAERMEYMERRWPRAVAERDEPEETPEKQKR